MLSSGLGELGMFVTVIWIAIALVLIALTMIWVTAPFSIAALKRQASRIVSQNDLLLTQISEINQRLERLVQLSEEGLRGQEAGRRG